MAVGTFSELILIGHYEDEWQLIPIILIVITSLFGVMIRPSKTLLNVFKVLLAACAFSGLLGVYFHLQANMEFEAELHPTQSYFTTFIESLSGALPALAPSSMIVFALIGYIYSLQLINRQK